MNWTVFATVLCIYSVLHIYLCVNIISFIYGSYETSGFAHANIRSRNFLSYTKFSNSFYWVPSEKLTVAQIFMKLSFMQADILLPRLGENTMVLILCQMNSFHDFPPCFSKMPSNIIVPFTPSSSNWSLQDI
jgi:hypothetical protein